MLKTLMSALIISGSLVATASFAYAQKQGELDSEKSVQNYRANDPAQAPVVLRVDPRTGTMSKLTLPAVPKTKEEAIQMISAADAKFEVIPANHIALNNDQSQALLKGGELDKDGGTPSWFRYGGGYGRGFGGGYYGYGRGYGWGGNVGYYNNSFYGGYNYAPIYYYPNYNNWVYGNYYSSYSPCQGFGWGGNNYSFYYGNGFAW